MDNNFTIRHTGIVVKDINESISFYRDLLQFNIYNEMDEEGPEISTFLGIKNVLIKTIKMKDSKGQMIELLYYKSSEKKDHKIKLDQIGPTHIALSVNNLDSVFNNLSKKGIKFLSSPQITSDKFAKVAFCIAPEGTFIELVQILEN